MGNLPREFTPNISATAAAPDHPPSSSPPPPPPPPAPLPDVVPVSFAATSVETSPKEQTPAVDDPADDHPASPSMEKQTERGDKRKGKDVIVKEGIPLEIRPKHPKILRLLEEQMIEKEKAKEKEKQLITRQKRYAMDVDELNKTVRESRMDTLEHMGTLKTNTKGLKYLFGKQEKNKPTLKLRKSETVWETVPEEDKGYKGSSEECGGEEEDEHREEAKEGDDDKDASRLCTKLEEDEKGAKNVDDVEDKYLSEMIGRVMALRKYFREYNCSYIPLGKGRVERIDDETWASYCKQIDDSEGKAKEKGKPLFTRPMPYATDVDELNKTVRDSRMDTLAVLEDLIGKQEKNKLKLKLRKSETVMGIVPEEDKGYQGSSEEYGGEEEDEHKEEAKDGDDDNDASSVCTKLEEDEKGAKNVDDVDDKYSAEVERRVMGLKKYIREDNCSYIPLGKERVDHETWASYNKQIDDSEGFDIKSYPGDCFMARIVPLQGIQNDPEYIQWGIKSVEDYNGKKGAKYQFHKLVSVNSRVADGQYLYITFQAKHPGNVCNVVTFQSLVHHGFTKDEVMFCRPKK